MSPAPWSSPGLIYSAAHPGVWLTCRNSKWSWCPDWGWTQEITRNRVQVLSCCPQPPQGRSGPRCRNNQRPKLLVGWPALWPSLPAAPQRWLPPSLRSGGLRPVGTEASTAHRTPAGQMIDVMSSGHPQASPCPFKVFGGLHPDVRSGWSHPGVTTLSLPAAA